MVTSIQAVVPVPTGKLKSSEGALKSTSRPNEQKGHVHNYF